MTRRSWLLIVGAGMCLSAVPGCRSTMPAGAVPQDGAQVQQVQISGGLLVKQGRDPLPDQWELNPPVRPDTNAVSPYHAIPAIPVAASGQQSELPPGQRVPEREGPRPLLEPPQLQPQLDWAQVFPPSTQPEVQKTQCESPVKDEPAVEALRLLLLKQAPKSLQCLESYDPQTQQMLMQLLPVVALMAEKPLPKMDTTEVMSLEAQLQRCIAPLRARTDLVIDKLCLCDQIDGYGMFTPRRDGRPFQPSELVQVYLELRNLAPELRDGYFIAALHGKVTISDREGTPVWSHNYSLQEQPLKAGWPRYDCYRVYDFYVPAGMQRGHYTLTLEITDETRSPRRSAKKSVEFQVQ
jgi:hypothetical protein